MPTTPLSRSLRLDSTVLRSERPFAAALPSGRLAMISLENAEFYGADPVGTEIWRLIETPRVVSELVDTIEAEYEVERPRVEADVLDFLHRLLERHLLHVVES